MDDKELTGRTCGILDEETRRKMQADMEARFNKIIQIGEMSFGEGLSDLGREREQAHRNRDESKITRVDFEPVTLEESRQTFSFTFGVPTWLPDGFTMDDKVRISGLLRGRRHPYLAIYCSHPEKRNFGLSIHLYENSPNVIYGIRGVEENGLLEVQVNGQPAALITRTRGFVYKTGEPIIMDHPRLVWMNDDVHYELTCSNNVLSTEEMIRIAESVRHDANLNTA